MAAHQDDFEQFMQRRAQAADAYVRGDVEPLRTIAAQRFPASFFGPQGGYETGVEEVWKAFEAGAASLSDDGETELEVLDLAAGDEVAYWAGIQHATVTVGDSAESTPMDLRVTEVFRREDGEWKLVHRHADPVAAEANR